MENWEGTNVGRTTATGVTALTQSEPTFRSVHTVALEVSDLIRLYKMQFGNDWRQYFAQTVRVEAKG